MKKNHIVKGVIFDLDGTLLDTLRDLAEAMNVVLKARGLPTYPLEKYRYFVGEGATVLVKKALPPRLHQPQIITEVLQEFLNQYGKNWDIYTQPYPGIPELLDTLQAQNIIMTILSNKVHDFTVQCAKKFLAQWNFSKIYGERPNIPRKPDPAGALAIAKELNLKPENFVFVGDTAIDMETANRAGMFGVGVTWGFRPKEELIEAGAKAIINKPEELIKIIDSQAG